MNTHKPIKPSTQALWRSGRSVEGYGLIDFLHGYFYGRWPYLYIGVGVGEHWLAKAIGPLLRLFSPRRTPESSGRYTAYEPRMTPGFADGYHGKVMPLDSIRQLVSVKEPVRLALPETVLPYHRAREIILNDPDHIVALECPCRAARENPCLPLDVCLIVGEPFASFVMEHHPTRARWIDSEEAEAILRAEDARGHVHHAFFKDAMLGRFYAICNCCPCCCGAMQAHRNGTPMLAASGYLAEVDPVLCGGCGTCESICPFGAVSVDDTSKVNEEKCMGCGVCVGQCPQQAIRLVAGDPNIEPLDLPVLMERAVAASIKPDN